MNTNWQDQIFGELWNAISDNEHRKDFEIGRFLKGKWRKIFKAHNLVPRRYLAILHLGNGHYAVESESRSGIMHSVDISEHGCSCENKQIEAKRQHLPADYRCKHMKLVERLIGEGIFPAPHEHK